MLATNWMFSLTKEYDRVTDSGFLLCVGWEFRISNGDLMFRMLEFACYDM